MKRAIPTRLIGVALITAACGSNGNTSPSDAGATPAMDSDNNPGTDAGTNPGTDAGTNPDTDAGTNPGTDAGTNPDTDAGTNPGTDAGTNPPPADVAVGTPVDHGFRPMPHGFAFENYSNTITVNGMTEPATNLGPEQMRRVFGPAVCEGGAATGACVLVPQAREWMQQQNVVMNNGHCEGMAVLASHFFSNVIPTAGFGAMEPFAMPLLGNVPLQQEVAVWFVTQTTVPNLERTTLTPRDVVAELTRDLARGRAFRGTIVGLYTSPGRGNGHAVTPFGIRYPNPNTAEILVYDNNFPNMERVVSVDLQANRFAYRTSTNPSQPSLDYIGDATTNTLTLTDIEPRTTFPHACAFCGNAQAVSGDMNRGSVQAELQGQGDLSIANGMGQVTGAGMGGNIVNQIPGARVTGRRTNFRDSPEPLYTLPRTGTYTLTLDGSRLTSMSPSDLHFYGQGFAIGIEGITLSPMQRDTVVLRTETPDVTYRASSSETPVLTVSFETAEADYLVEVRSSAVAAGQNLRLLLDPAAQRVRLRFDGSASAPMFELYMERVSASGVVSFDHRGVAGSAQSVLSFPYAMWGGNGMALRMEVDSDGNGSVDTTQELSDDN